MAEGRAYGLSCATLCMAALCSPYSRAGGEHDLARFGRGAPIPRSSWTVETTQPARKFQADSAHARPECFTRQHTRAPAGGSMPYVCMRAVYWGNCWENWVRTSCSISMSTMEHTKLRLSLAAQPRSFGKTALRVVRSVVSAPV